MADLDLIRDFVNTIDREEDSDDLDRWLAEHRPSRGRTRATDVAEARAVREALRELLRANNGVGADLAGPSKTLDAAARRAGLAVRFHDGSIKLMARAGGSVGALALVLAAVAEAMADGSWIRLKACRSDTCQWAFVDNARNRSRHWCDMSVCGNRQKVRTFRSRHA
jgi:predicted RNA-binding Zn ribbon-like protein